MLKQILAKIPRKSTKTDSLNPIDLNSCDENSNTNSGNASQFINTCTVLPSRLNVMKRIFPSGGGEPLLPFMPFKDVSNTEKPNLFVLKLNFCCLVYNFNDPSKNSTEKEIKFQILSELNEFVGSGSAKFTEAAIAAVCKMCASNLFRDFPPKNNYLNIDEEPLFDPAWTHLQLVYDFLLEVLSQNSLDPKVAKKYINQTFILKLLDLFDSEDPRERECLKSILHRLYGKLMMTRPLIRKTVSNILYRFVFETQRHNGVSELLEVFGSVISGFALPLKEEHRIFLTKALIPLHKPKCLGVYHQQLSYCIIQFVEKDQKLASVVIKGLLKYWPVTNSQKELMFISELEEVLEMINMSDFEIIMVPLFRRIGFCLNSSHIQVAERAHYLWNNDHILNLTMHHRGIIMPIIFSALEKNSRNHWNKAVLNLTQNVRKVFFEMDEELALSCQSKLEDEISKVNMADEKRRLTWESLETAAKFQQLPIILSSITEPVTTTCVVAC